MTIADDELKAILDGCDELPAGPYEQRHDDEVWDARGKWFAVSSEEGAAHIARLDPDTVKAIVSELLALRQSSPPDGQTAPDAWWTDIFESLPNGKLSRLLLTADQVKNPDPDWKPLVFATPSSETKAPGEEH